MCVDVGRADFGGERRLFAGFELGDARGSHFDGRSGGRRVRALRAVAVRPELERLGGLFLLSPVVVESVERDHAFFAGGCPKPAEQDRAAGRGRRDRAAFGLSGFADTASRPPDHLRFGRLARFRFRIVQGQRHRWRSAAARAHGATGYASQVDLARARSFGHEGHRRPGGFFGAEHHERHFFIEREEQARCRFEFFSGRSRRFVLDGEFPDLVFIPFLADVGTRFGFHRGEHPAAGCDDRRVRDAFVFQFVPRRRRSAVVDRGHCLFPRSDARAMLFFRSLFLRS